MDKGRRDTLTLPIPLSLTPHPSPMLDEYADPPRDDKTLADRRAALVDQLGWLEDEAAALGPLLAALAAWAVEQAPMPDDLSVNESLAVLAALDRDVYPQMVARARAEETPMLQTPEPDSSAAEGASLHSLLAAVRDARAAFRAEVEAVPAAAWSRRLVLDGTETDLYGLLLAIVQRDADRLRELAYRLHDADLRPRTPADDVPKRPE